MLRKKPAGTRELLYYPPCMRNILQDTSRYADIISGPGRYPDKRQEGLTINSSSIPRRAELVDFYEGTTKEMIT